MAEPSAAPLAEASRAKLEAEPETDQQEEGTNDAVRRKKQDRARTALKALESPQLSVETGETPFPPMGVELTTSRLEAEKKSRYATRPQL